MYIHISCKQDLGDQIKLLSVSLYVTHLQEKMCECTAFFLSYTCVYACITLSRGRALSAFSCSCRVLQFCLFYAQHAWKLKQRTCPRVCASATEAVLHFLFGAMVLQEEQKWGEANPKVEVQGGLVQLRGLCACWESSSLPCSAGVGHKHCSLGGCVHNACWFIVLTVSFHSSVIQNTFGEWIFLTHHLCSYLSVGYFVYFRCFFAFKLNCIICKMKKTQQKHFVCILAKNYKE